MKMCCVNQISNKLQSETGFSWIHAYLEPVRSHDAWSSYLACHSGAKVTHLSLWTHMEMSSDYIHTQVHQYLMPTAKA